MYKIIKKNDTTSEIMASDGGGKRRQNAKFLNLIF